jgi:dUTPase
LDSILLINYEVKNLSLKSQTSNIKHIFVHMPAIEVKIINKSFNELPAYATAGSSGMDIRAFLNTPKTLLPFERALIPTGLFIELPDGYEVQVRPRSGLAVKQGITCLNTPDRCRLPWGN